MRTFATEMKTYLEAGIWDNFCNEALNLNQTRWVTILDSDFSDDTFTNFPEMAAPSDPDSMAIVATHDGESNVGKIITTTSTGGVEYEITETEFYFQVRLWPTDTTHDHFVLIYNDSDEAIGGFKLGSDGKIYAIGETKDTYVDTTETYTAATWTTFSFHFNQNTLNRVWAAETRIHKEGAPNEVPAKVVIMVDSSTLYITHLNSIESDFRPKMRIVGVSEHGTNKPTGVNLINQTGTPNEIASDGKIIVRYLAGQIESFSPKEEMVDAMQLDIEQIVISAVPYTLLNNEPIPLKEGFAHLYTIEFIGC